MNTDCGFPLEPQAEKAVLYRGGHMQIIAPAGSGKTEVVAMRIVRLLDEGTPPHAIVAFTFTERAANSLKTRIEQRVAQCIGEEALNKLNGMFVGTIHAYCFRLMQTHVPECEMFDVLDDNRLTAFLVRISRDMDLNALEGGTYRSARTFLANLAVVENELIDHADLEEPFRSIYERYREELGNHRFLTYGQMIASAVEVLKDPTTFERVHAPLRHLIVDEYQDVNPAQERLIRALSAAPVQLCVVGDDDQSIYQWRGADVSNIVTFTDRYEVKTFTIRNNWRSRRAIVELANGFAASIQGRLPKVMLPTRDEQATISFWSAVTEADQAAAIVKTVGAALRRGYRYRDIAILCRTRKSLVPLLTALEEAKVPVKPGGRTNLFFQLEADLLGRTISWLVDRDWLKNRFDLRHDRAKEEVTIGSLLRSYSRIFELSHTQARRLRSHLEAWKSRIDQQEHPADLVGGFYEVLYIAGVENWDLDDSTSVNRLGTLARCTQLLADFESTRRRARATRRDGYVPGEDRGRWYYVSLAIFLENWARGAYEDFEGEESLDLNAVDLTTIHQAKGLEWPLVFVPSLTIDRFPPTGGHRTNWHIPLDKVDLSRCEGGEAEERRLFYVAMTRARDALYLSRFERINTERAPSPFLVEVANGNFPLRKRLPSPPVIEAAGEEAEEPAQLSFSDLAAYLECGLAFRLRRLIGFQPALAPEIGYGKAVHHAIRQISETFRESRKIPSSEEIEDIFKDHFYVPAANPRGYEQMRERARAMVTRYLREWESDLRQVWEVERPFELHLGSAVVSGRADVVLDRSSTGAPKLSIVDYKTAANRHDAHDFQLQIYTSAGRREGWDVENAYVHDLREALRHDVPVDSEVIAAVEAQVEELVAGMRARHHPPRPGPVCKRCDVAAICRFRAAEFSWEARSTITRGHR